MMKRKKIAELIESSDFGSEVTLMGWVRTRRDSKGGFSFLEINDGSTIKNIQVLAQGTLANYAQEISKLTTGCSVIVKGILVESPGKGQKVEVQATEVTVVGWADPETYPLQKKRHSFEHLRTIAHLRPRTNTFGAVARIRNAMSYAIHSFFQERGFIYLHSPIITGSNCEGAGDMFKVTTLDLQGPNKDKGGEVDFREDFFGKPASLTVSGQLEAEVYALALGNVYTFGPTFRAEDSNTSRHLAEFWMVEPEMAFCDLKEDIDLAEEFIKSILAYILKNCKDDMDFLNGFVGKDHISTIDDIINSYFEHLTYTEAIDILSEVRERFEFPVEWGKDIQSEHERYICTYFKRPVVVTDYPKAIKPFYMKVNKDGRTVKAMDILLPGVGEIIGGSQREDDYETLLNRIKEMNLDPADYWWYLELRRYGTVIHSGFGLGFERLIQFVTGLSNIRDVIPFPRTPKNLEF